MIRHFLISFFYAFFVEYTDIELNGFLANFWEVGVEKEWIMEKKVNWGTELAL